MQEIFEKIIEDLKEQRNKANNQCFHEARLAFEKALDIVREHSHNNGWIPCSERLPEKNKVVLIYAESLCREGNVYTIGSVSNGCWFTESGVGLLSYPNGNRYKVIAWQPLPPRYEPKED